MLIGILLLLQGAAGTVPPPAGRPAAAPRAVRPVLTFPEPGLDDTAAYQGYRTRFFRDASGNTLQVYLDRREARVVHLWADAENESIGFTARDAAGQPAPLRWGAEGATVARAGRRRTLRYDLMADAPRVDLGWFLLGSMRVERDFQAWGRHRRPFTDAPFLLDELERLLGALDQLPPATQRAHLAHFRAPTVAALRARLHPTVSTIATPARWTTRIVQPSPDGRDTITLDISADPRRVAATRAGRALTLAARTGAAVAFTVEIGTTGAALTPLTRQEIFTPEFLAFVAGAGGAASSGAASGTPARDSAAIRARWLERQVIGVELLSSREKLMAGLPTYATYFGRDMLMTALMMRPIWREAMSEAVIGSVLRKLAPDGQVSHEEALGGQAVREAADEYARLVAAHRDAAGRGDQPAADSLLARAGTVLRDHRRVRENYHMIDDELHLPILTARWLGDPGMDGARKRAFLAAPGPDGTPRLAGLLRELGQVARMTAPYAAEATVTNLIAFAPRDSGRWASTSWRDSNAGYANGRYAMDVNAIWAPHAIESLGAILDAVRALGLPLDSLAGAMPELAATTPIGRWLRDRQALRAAADAWWGASRHFLVRRAPAEIGAAVEARLATMPPVEREHWTRVLAGTGAAGDSLTFMALALDAQGRPLGVASTDVATQLFLGERRGRDAAPDAATREAVLRDVRLFVRAYPVGLFIEGVGPVVANDAYATRAVWDDFVKDPYHGPRVAWGREVNLFLLGVANRIAAARGATDPATQAYVRELGDAAARVQAAVEASGFQSELWSYDFRDGRPVPVRYGSGADVQLWSTTDLVVQWALSRMNGR